MRIRTVKPEFWESESIGRLSRDARLLFIGLFSFADDAGIFRATPRLIANRLFTYDEDALDLIDGWLEELTREECVNLYTVGLNSYGIIPNFLTHQRIDHPARSRLPTLPRQNKDGKPREESRNPREASRLDQGKGSRDQGSREREGVPPAPAPRSPETDQGRASDPGIPPDSRPLQAETPPPLHHEPPPAPKSLKTPPTASRPVAFDPPTRQQLIDFLVDEWGVKHAEQIGMDSADRVGVEMDKFLDHFAALGWRMKSGPMRDWKAAFRNWIRRVPDFAPDPPASRRRGR